MLDVTFVLFILKLYKKTFEIQHELAICLCTTYLCEVNTKTEGQKLKVTSAFLAKSKNRIEIKFGINKNTETAYDTLYISSGFTIFYRM